MKKLKLISLVPLSMAGAALAQVASTGSGPVAGSNVNLFGVVDAAVAYGRGDLSHNTRLVSGGNTSSRLGFRGVEDLGGGVGAGFWLEMGVNADNGTGAASSTNNQLNGGAGCTVGNAVPAIAALPVTCTSNAAGSQGTTFNRRSTVSLLSQFGELRLGRDYVSTYRNRDQVDPFSTNGVGGNLADALNITPVTGVRASNMIAYYLPSLSGFFGEAQYYFGENASNTVNHEDGSGYQARLGYGLGPWGIAAAGGRTRYARSATIGEVSSWNVAGNFSFGWGTLSGGWYEDKIERLVPVKAKGYLVGGVFPIGASQIKASFSSYETDEVGTPTARKLALGYVYNMSKRTAAYLTYAHLDNNGPSAVSLNGSTTTIGKNSDGVDIGLKHSF